MPTKQDEVEAYLGNKKIDVPGLEAKDIKLLLDGIHNHALNWNKLYYLTSMACALCFAEIEEFGGASFPFERNLLE